jgi:very-short-patch-repair endonuclease
MTLEEFINKAVVIHNNFYDYSLVEYKNNKTKIRIICPVHGIFEQKPSGHLHGQRCKKCYLSNRDNGKNSIETVLNNFKVIHNDLYDYSLVEYKNNITKVKIICKNHGVFEQTPKNHSKGHGCPICATNYKSKKLSKSVEKFIKQSKRLHKNFYNYDKIEYKNNKTNVIIICPNHGEFRVTPSHHLNGIGCSKCSGNYRKNTQEFISECIKIHNYDYSLVEYVNTKTKVKIICDKHGIFEQKPSHHLMGCGCPKCISSKGENKIRLYLNNLNINFIEQKRFKDCRNILPLPFDFYLPEHNICIEYDGDQHFKSIDGWGGEKAYLRRIKNDNIKNDYCKNKQINLIRISFKEDINTILQRILL